MHACLTKKRCMHRQELSRLHRQFDMKLQPAASLLGMHWCWSLSVILCLAKLQSTECRLNIAMVQAFLPLSKQGCLSGIAPFAVVLFQAVLLNAYIASSICKSPQCCSALAGVLHVVWTPSEKHNFANATRGLQRYRKAECWKCAWRHDTCS